MIHRPQQEAAMETVNLPYPPGWVAMLLVGGPILLGYGVIIWLVITAVWERFFKKG